MSSNQDEQQRELAETGLKVTKFIYFMMGLILGGIVSFMAGYMFGVGLF